MAWIPEPGSGGVSDHGELDGLGDDDHTQYLNTVRHAAIDAADHGSGAATYGQVLTADGAGGAAWKDPTGGGAFAETIGDNSNTSFQIQHNLGTQDLVVQLWDLTGAEPIEATGDASQIKIDDDNSITVTFSAAPATDSYRVVILASGGSTGGGCGCVGDGCAKTAPEETYLLLAVIVVNVRGTISYAGEVDTIYYFPIVVREALQITGVVAEITGGTGSGRLARIGIYEADFDLQPTALVGEGEVDCSTTGIKSVAVAETLPPGRYLL